MAWTEKAEIPVDHDGSSHAMAGLWSYAKWEGQTGVISQPFMARYSTVIALSTISTFIVPMIISNDIAWGIEECNITFLSAFVKILCSFIRLNKST